jgi:hypothetical protein
MKEIPFVEEGKNKVSITSSDAAGIKGSEEPELWPFENSVMGSDFCDLFFIPLDTPEGTDVVSINEAVSIVLLTLGGVPVKE